MKIKVAWIGKTKEPAIQTLTDEYLKRISRYAEVAGLALKDEAAILSMASGERKQKERHKLVLLDSRGKQFSSEELAKFLEREQMNCYAACVRGWRQRWLQLMKRGARRPLRCPWER